MPRPTAADADLASAVRPAILRLARRLRQMRDESLELSPAQLSALGSVLRCQPVTMGELAQVEHVKPPSMTRTVDSLEQAGLVERREGADRRQSTVSVTAAGREIVVADRRRRDAWLAGRIAELDPADVEALRRAVEVLEKVNQP